MKDEWKVSYLHYSATCFTPTGAEVKCKHVLHSKRMALILSGQTRELIPLYLAYIQFLSDFFQHFSGREERVRTNVSGYNSIAKCWS